MFFGSAGSAVCSLVAPIFLTVKHKFPVAEQTFSFYLSKACSPDSLFSFQPVTPAEIELEILSIPNNKSFDLYSCSTTLLKYASSSIKETSEILNLSVQLGLYPLKLKI